MPKVLARKVPVQKPIGEVVEGSAVKKMKRHRRTAKLLGIAPELFSSKYNQKHVSFFLQSYRLILW